jgi:hypothetical protein
MTRVVISQPMYFPWVGFLAQMALADVMIWLDDVQFSKGSFTNRVQVKTNDGVKWMSVPLVGKGSHKQIMDLETSDPKIGTKHRSLLANALADAPFRDEALGLLETAWKPASLVECLIASAECLADAVALAPRSTFRSSQMGVAGNGSERVLGLVQAVGGTCYVTGHGARNYLEHARFEDVGIGVEYMQYQPKPWPQAQGDFTPYVTALDLVAQVPPAERVVHLAPATEHWKSFIERH